MPPRNPNFIGRQPELNQIEDSFRRAQGTSSFTSGALGPHATVGGDQGRTIESGGATEAVGVTMIQVVGLGGIGKTQIASEYCYRGYGSRSICQEDHLVSDLPDLSDLSDLSDLPDLPDQRPTRVEGRASAATTTLAGLAGYGLIVWLRAESHELLANDLRNLAEVSGCKRQHRRVGRVQGSMNGIIGTSTP